MPRHRPSSAEFGRAVGRSPEALGWQSACPLMSGARELLGGE
ncbi:hypothetical protein trd_0568 [Thermomicrobium roseum DSM 5159]|uniref:Uncharacterized protein n=1 Tax=Thermomicrobium roseum (strain ATCC 27502 / DSM 5159 / P-2) TaxID=309801 RepID=B9KYM1_THERP|nr:hypothetical protein trd_0568 [Thermomicrobium roseum DSM 5159]